MGETDLLRLVLGVYSDRICRADVDIVAHDVPASNQGRELPTRTSEPTISLVWCNMFDMGVSMIFDKALWSSLTPSPPRDLRIVD